nr:class I SAM-dependent methyltransferase [uncultured Rhodopila sp.]
MDRWYPDKIFASSVDDYLPRLPEASFTTPLIAGLGRLFSGVDRDLLKFAEFGVWKGGTSGQLAKFLNNKGELHLFDYHDTVAELVDKLARAGFSNVTAWPSSYRYLDSYNWSLRVILESHRDLRFDYIYLDGAHTWAIDALTFLLCDLLLNVGGYINFDDYHWRLRGSSLDPARVPLTAQLYPETQIDDFQVKAIVELLVRRSGNYREIAKDRLFQKIAK